MSATFLFLYPSSPLFPCENASPSTVNSFETGELNLRSETNKRFLKITKRSVKMI
jgi:hypothetical protein